MSGCGQPALDLIVTMDDATSAIYSAFLVEEEGTASTFRALARSIWRARPAAEPLYRSGKSLFYTPEAGGKVDRASLTQVGRALAHLGVEHIAAYSPQARGRSERLFQTLQDRLAEGTGAGRDRHDGGRQRLHPRSSISPPTTRASPIEAEQEGSAFVAMPGVDLGEILCVQEDRSVGNDNCVAFNRLRLQIPESPLRAHFVNARVKVHQYPDGSHAVFHGRRCLGRYDNKGLFSQEKIAA